MTTRIIWLGSAAVLLSLAFLAGCGRNKKEAEPKDGGAAITAPVPDGTKPVEEGDKPVKDGVKGVGEGPKVPLPVATVFEAIELSRRLVKEPDFATPFLNKPVQIEGVIVSVDLRPGGFDPDDARVILQGAADDADKNKHVKIICGLRDKAGVAKIGPGQTVTIEGTFLYAAPTVWLMKATVVKAGPVAVTQVEMERRLGDEPKTIEALEALGAQVERNRYGKVEKLRLPKGLVAEGQVKAEVLAEMVKLSEIGELWLRGTRISDAGLACVKKLTKVGGLDLYDTKVTDAGLAQLKGLSSLRRLRLSYSQQTERSAVSDAGLAHLVGLDLEELAVEKANVTDAGLAHLAGFTGLRSLELSHNKISDDGFALLKNLGKLQVLKLSGTKITDKTVTSIGRLRELTRLEVANCQVSDDGVAALASLTKLVELNLRSTFITDASLRHVEKMRLLKTLELSRDVKATEEGVMKLKEVLPDLEVVVSDE